MTTAARSRIRSRPAGKPLGGPAGPRRARVAGPPRPVPVPVPVPLAQGTGAPPYRVARARLASGLRLVTVATPHLHTATVVVYVRAGSRYETRRTSGLSHFVEHMLFRGGGRYPDSLSLNRAIEELGGTLYAETGRDYSLYQVSLGPREVGGGLDILGELLAAPTFRDIELERQIILEEILEDLDDRGRNVNLDDRSRRAAFGDHPLGFPICGPPANVRRFAVGDVRRHFARLYGARNMVLCVAGPVRHHDVLRRARRAFAAVPAGRAVRPRPAALPRRGPTLEVVPSDAAQVQVHVLFAGLPERDPDYLGLAALVRVLDDGMSTRLHYRICDQKGLAYHVAGSLEPLHDTALFEIDAACAPAKLPALLGEAFAILRQLRDEDVEPAELAKARLRTHRDLEAACDDIDGLSGWYGGTELFFRPRTHAQRARLMARLRASHIRRAARRVLQRERLTVVVVGKLTRRIEREVRRTVRAFR